MATIAPAPARASIHQEGLPEPCVVVIFGVTGDLAHRKLIPALANLAAEGRLPRGTTLVGFARRPLALDQFHQDIVQTAGQNARRQSAPEHEEVFADDRYV